MVQKIGLFDLINTKIAVDPNLFLPWKLISIDKTDLSYDYNTIQQILRLFGNIDFQSILKAEILQFRKEEIDNADYYLEIERDQISDSVISQFEIFLINLYEKLVDSKRFLSYEINSYEGYKGSIDLSLNEINRYKILVNFSEQHITYSIIDLNDKMNRRSGVSKNNSIGQNSIILSIIDELSHFIPYGGYVRVWARD